MSAWIQKQWYRLTAWHILFIPLSWLFFILSVARRQAYRQGWFKSHRLSLPVIVVGNISVGGTGKTPLVIWLAKQLMATGWRPLIVSRGYGAKQLSATLSVNASSRAEQVGDEPVLIASRTKCPVWVGKNRVEVGRTALAAHPECNIVICDDGLQHYALQRDIEIAVIDAERGFGNGLLLPAGPLRESVARLDTVDAVVSNGGDGEVGRFAMSLEGKQFENLLNADINAFSNDFFGKAIHAVAGIGSPARFFNQLRSLGLQFEPHAFPDHHPFQPSDLQSLQAEVILMTEKDAVKCKSFAQENWWYLPVDAKVEPDLLLAIKNKLLSKKSNT